MSVFPRATWTRLHRGCSISLIANFESLSSPMTPVYLANEPLTRNDCHVGIQKLFGAINRDEEEKTAGKMKNLATDSGFSREAFQDASGMKVEVEFRAKYHLLSSFERARTCRMWRRNPLGGTKKFSDPSRALLGARVRSPSPCCPLFEKILRVFM